MKKWIILTNVVFLCVCAVNTMNHHFEEMRANAFIRDRLLMPKKCKDYLPSNVVYLYRNQHNEDLLLFALFADSIYEYYFLEYSKGDLKKTNFKDQQKNAFDIVQNNPENDKIVRLCEKNSESKLCFRSISDNLYINYFETHLDSVGAFLKCLATN